MEDKEMENEIKRLRRRVLYLEAAVEKLKRLVEPSATRIDRPERR